MSERLEQWKAREKLRERLGPAAVGTGLAGLLVIAAGVAELLSIPGFEGEFRVLGWPAPPALTLLGGIGLVLLAIGFWSARAWVWWLLLALFGVSSVLGAISAVRARQLSAALLFDLTATVYLLLPSTRRRFAQAEALRAWERSDGARFFRSRPTAPGP